MLIKARTTHNNFYDYSKVIYESANIKVDIICPVHGVFQQLLRKHIAGQKCAKCAFAKPHNSKDLNHFLKRAKTKHGDYYDYSHVEYTNCHNKVTIVCPNHGEFSQEAMSHMAGSGCPKCRKPQKSNKTITYEDFLNMARQRHGTKYEYVATTFTSMSKSMTVQCDIHGETSITPRHHLKGSGCKFCSIKAKSERKQYDLKDLLLHDEYEYIKIEGKHVIYKCPRHGIIKQLIQEHIRGAKCKACAYDDFSKCNRADIGLQHKQLTEIFNDRLKFDFTDYVNQDSLIEVECSEHGVFKKDVKHLLRGQGCAKCNVSSPHAKLLTELSKVTTIYVNDRIVLKPYEIDLYVPDRKIGVEVNGLYWHSYDHKESKAEQYRHYDKAELATMSGVRLYQFWEYEILNKFDTVLSMIKLSFGMATPYQARKCKIVDGCDLRDFFALNHLYGYRPAHINLALQHDNVICMAINFYHRGGGVYEIMRSASLNNSVIKGGFNKILAYFIRMYKPLRIYSYCDRRFSTGMSYHNAGFKLVKVTKPGYFYVKGNVMHNRQKFQKYKLAGLLNDFDPTLSESSNMFNNGYRRLWDAGHFLFERNCI
jgi:very-short-patch-repair endonuclease